MHIGVEILSYDDTHVPDPDSANGYDFVSPRIKSGQLGVQNDKFAFLDRPALIECEEQLLVRLEHRMFGFALKPFSNPMKSHGHSPSKNKPHQYSSVKPSFATKV